jgi:hypothetical protein
VRAVQFESIVLNIEMAATFIDRYLNGCVDEKLTTRNQLAKGHLCMMSYEGHSQVYTGSSQRADRNGQVRRVL